jgi:hypothetical protein
MARSYEIRRTIEATPERIWELLTDAEDYHQWNPAVLSLRGEIVDSGAIELVSAENPKRTFKLIVSGVEPARGMVWSSGMPLGLFSGVRTFSLDPLGGEQVEFTMRETYSGLLAAAITRAIPDLTKSFEQFADGLKLAAESGSA